MQNVVGVGTGLARKHPVAVGHLFRFLLIVVIILGSLLLVREFDLDVPLLGSNGCSDNNMYISERDVMLSPQSTQQYKLELAKTPSQQELGLSDRPCYPTDGALLFLFPTDDKFGIWMKNMNFNIDVVWLNSDKKIVHIERNMAPNSFPKVFYPQSDARYVIEVNAGQVDNVLKAGVGTQLQW